MANNYFEFKQFKIYQKNAAMKVGTDGVLLGAWTDLSGVGKALDIGTGTGLIALMMAQREPFIKIHALDIELGAFLQASYNVSISKWSERIKVEHTSFQKFWPTTNCYFDLIVSNPPFYTTSVTSPDIKRSMARHFNTLPLIDILDGSAHILSPMGTLSMVLPFKEYENINIIASKMGFFEKRKLVVYPTNSKQAVRVLSQWSLHKVEFVEKNELVIEPNLRHHYSPEYISLTKDFYLKM